MFPFIFIEVVVFRRRDILTVCGENGKVIETYRCTELELSNKSKEGRWIWE